MSEAQPRIPNRRRMETTVLRAIGLELWLTGEAELTPTELLDIISGLKVRIAVAESILRKEHPEIGDQKAPWEE